MGETFGYDKETKQLVLVDFEKVQISHSAYDYAFFVQNPRQDKWNRISESKLFAKYPSVEFKMLYNLTKLLKLLSDVSNIRTGRLDDVFIPIAWGKTEFEKIKQEFVPQWEEEILELMLTFND